jgi:hypothetical protein
MSHEKHRTRDYIPDSSPNAAFEGSPILSASSRSAENKSARATSRYIGDALTLAMPEIRPNPT